MTNPQTEGTEIRNANRDINLILLITAVALVANILLRPAAFALDKAHALPLRTLVVLLVQFAMMGLGVLVVLLHRRESIADYGVRRSNFFQSLCLSLLCFLPMIALYFVRGVRGYYPMANIITVGEWVGRGMPLALAGVLPAMLVWGVIQAIGYCVLADKLDLTDPVKNPWLRVGPIYCAIFYLVLNGFGFSLARLPELLVTFFTIWALMQARRISRNSWGMILVFSFLLNGFL